MNMNSGYCGWSRSQRAAEATNDYKFSRSELCRLLGLRPKTVAEHLAPCEAHHTSKYANLTDFYDARDCVRTRDINRLTLNAPNARQFEQREEICHKLLTELWGRTVRLGRVFTALRNRESLSLKAKITADKRTARRELIAAESAAYQENSERTCRAKSAQDYNESLRLRCRSQGITRDKITSAITNPPPADPCCQASQIRKWFGGMPLDEAVAFAIQGNQDD